MYVRNKFTVHNHCNNRVHVNWPLSHDLDLFGFVLVPDRSPFRVMLVRSGRGAAELLLVRRFTNHDFSLSDARTTLLFSPPTKLSFTRLLCRITVLRAKNARETTRSRIVDARKTKRRCGNRIDARHARPPRPTPNGDKDEDDVATIGNRDNGNDVNEHKERR